MGMILPDPQRGDDHIEVWGDDYKEESVTMSTQMSISLVNSPDVCGGHLRIEGTRITVNQIVVLYKQGYGPEEIADQYPQLTLAQAYAALAYYHANREEIEADLAAEKLEAERLEKEYQQAVRPA
jgi:uncharacterized protein (DUF433 family)